VTCFDFVLTIDGFVFDEDEEERMSPRGLEMFEIVVVVVVVAVGGDCSSSSLFSSLSFLLFLFFLTILKVADSDIGEDLYAVEFERIFSLCSIEAMARPAFDSFVFSKNPTKQTNKKTNQHR